MRVSKAARWQREVVGTQRADTIRPYGFYRQLYGSQNAVDFNLSLCYTDFMKEREAVPMLNASDFRYRAREALCGHWGTAIAVSFVFSLLSGATAPGGSGERAQNIGLSVSVQMQTMLTTMSIAAILLAVALGGVMAMGQATYFTKLVDDREPRFGDLFSQFHRIGTGIAMVLLQNLFVLLWSLLFLIPGIVASYRYALMPYLLAEHEDLGALDAMRESKRLMYGNKLRLFYLHLSFLGWCFLAVFTFGIGILWLSPYIEAANAAFYRSVLEEDQKRPIF